MNKMIIMRGASGSGKSTLARQLWLDNPGSVILSTDEIYGADISGGIYDEPQRAYLWSADALRECHFINQVKTKNACVKGIPLVIVDNTNTTWKEIEPYVDIALKYGYEIEVKEPETDWKSDVDELNNKNVHAVPKDVISKQLGRFEPTDSIEMKIAMKRSKK